MSQNGFALALLEEYGTALAGDLLVHLVSGMNYMMGWNEPPKKVMALGAIIRFPVWTQHARLQALSMSTPPLRARPSICASISACEGPETYRFQGSKESSKSRVRPRPLSANRRRFRPSYYTSGYPQACAKRI